MSSLRFLKCRIRGIKTWLSRWVKREHAETELAEEFRFHVEQKTAQNLRSGMNEEQARRHALVAFGGVERYKEEVRETQGVRPLEHAIQDIRVAFRRLRQTPSFTMVAVATLAFGIAANTIVFSLIDTVFMKPLPYSESDRLVVLQESDSRMRLNTSFEAYQYFEQNSRSFETLGAYSRATMVLLETEDPIRLFGACVSAGFLSMLDVPPLLGRGFLPEEDLPGAERVVILSHATWNTMFGGDRDVLGRTIRTEAGNRTVVGVMPPDFWFLDEDAQYWVTLSDTPRSPTFRSLTMVGRLAPDAALESAGEEAQQIGMRLAEDNGPAKGGEFTRAHSLKDHLIDPRIPALLTALAVSVILLLLIAVANLTNLLLVRMQSREREIRVRRVLGASNSRLVITGIAEPLVLASISWVAGMLWAYWALSTLRTLSSVSLPQQTMLGLQPRAAVFALTLSIAIGVLVGMLTLVGARPARLQSELHAGSRSTRVNTIQNILTVTQVALTLSLLAGLSLLVKTVDSLQRVELGFDADRVLAVDLRLGQSSFSSPESRLAFYDELAARIEGLPGVAATGYASGLPLGPGWNDIPVVVEGMPEHEDEPPVLEYDYVTPGFFETMGVDLRKGRLFAWSDGDGAEPVALVNETAAQSHFPEGEAVGQQMTLLANGRRIGLTVLGVVEDVRHHRLTEEATPKFYLMMDRSRPWPFGMQMVARTDNQDPTATVAMLRGVVREAVAEGAIAEVSPLQVRIDRSVAGPTFNAALLGVFAIAALCLAALGLYGVVAFGVAQRHKEIGIRIAVGARPRQVWGETLARGLRLTLVGILLGIPSALLMGRILASNLFGVGSYDLNVLAAVALFLGTVSTFACLVPSVRASRIDPMVSLSVD